MDEIGFDIQFGSAIIGNMLNAGKIIMTTFENIWSTDPEAGKNFLAKLKRTEVEKQGKESVMLISAIVGVGLGIYLIFKSLEG